MQLFRVTDTAHLKRRLYLSTVHRELSTTLWHSKIPLIGLNHNIVREVHCLWFIEYHIQCNTTIYILSASCIISQWSTLCIDLVSFTRKLFKDVAFVSLDGITVYANCCVRRIFTMKAEPEGVEGKVICPVYSELLMKQVLLNWLFWL